jgi:hypothetical protein
MNDETPQALKNAAIAQLVSGLINFMVMPGIMWFAWSMFAGVCSVFTFGLGSLFGLCGFVSCLLVPIGMVEMVSGGLTLANPRQGAPIMKIVAMVEMASLLCGGFISCIAGFVVSRMLADEQVQGYLSAS